MVIVKVFIAHDGLGDTEIEVGRIEVSRQHEYPDGTADYTIRYAVERGMAVGLHTRGVDGFPRKRYNVLALLLQALNTLSPKELELERGFDPDNEPSPRASNLARRLNRARNKVQEGPDQWDHY